MNISPGLDGLTPFILENNRTVTDSLYNSVYRGIVENISDPLTLGRVQVRVPAIHGIECGTDTDVSPTNQFIPTSKLPWAHAVTLGGVSHDRGTSLPYCCGSLVLVVFENGHKTTPVVIGGFHFFPNHYYYLNTDLYKKLPDYKVPVGLDCQSHPQPTVPREAALTYRQSPTRFVIHKSQKGHTIWGEDRDDDECFEIIDRTGQGLRMEGFISVDDNKENKFRRGVRSVFSKSGVIKAPVTRTILKETGNNSLTLESFQGEKRTRLGSGKSRVEIDGTRDRVIAGSLTGSQLIEVDNETQTIILKSPKIIIDANDIMIKGQTRFYNIVEVLDNLYSHKKFISNETSDHHPRLVV